VVIIKAKESEKKSDMSHAESSLLLTPGQQDLTYSALMEATEERKLAAIRISELVREAVDTLLRDAEKTACS